MALRNKQPELPGCEPMTMRFKDFPTVNSDDKELALCQLCRGSGTTCTANRTVENKGKVTTEYADFAGSELKKRVRAGWSVESKTCFQCSGAGLHVKKSA